MSLCLTCAHAHIVSAPIRRRVGDPTLTDEIRSLSCKENVDIYRTIKDRVPNNHQLVETEGFITVSECSVYEKADAIFKYTAVKIEDLTAIGNTYVNSEELNAKTQWERISNLLEQNGFSIISRKK